MKKIICLSLLLSTVLIGSLYAYTKKETSTSSSVGQTTEMITQSSEQSQQDTNKHRQTSSVLWRVEKSGKPVSYLLGTIHIGKIGSSLPKEMVQALSESKVLITEANMEPDFQELMQLSQLMLDPQGNLEQKLGEHDFRALASMTKNVPAQALKQFKPWAAFTLAMYGTPNGYSEEFGIDKLLTKQAITTDKERVFLEKIEEQLQFFADVPEEKIISALKVMLQNATSTQAETQKLIDFYEKNNLDQLAALTLNKENTLKNFPPNDQKYWAHWFYETLLKERNHHWLAVIDQQLSQQSTLIAVGSAHLMGENGLIQLLKNKGYTLTPISLN
ncbi:TraB/GumN family protein [Neisseria sp. Ec49-e6-T10]|uniref:TraB/GumN family protein n=1 Tax=Neisseria sp. Ec49-e6-T10 TaxID=3140744 RepID=UPI003EBD2A1C